MAALFGHILYTIPLPLSLKMLKKQAYEGKNKVYHKDIGKE
jgi:hypothetical protein